MLGQTIRFILRRRKLGLGKRGLHGVKLATRGHEPQRGVSVLAPRCRCGGRTGGSTCPVSAPVGSDGCVLTVWSHVSGVMLFLCAWE